MSFMKMWFTLNVCSVFTVWSFLLGRKSSFLCVCATCAFLSGPFYPTHASQTRKQLRLIFNCPQKRCIYFDSFFSLFFIHVYFCLCIFMSFSLCSFFSLDVFTSVCLCSKDVAHLFFLRAKCLTSARVSPARFLFFTWAESFSTSLKFLQAFLQYPQITTKVVRLVRLGGFSFEKVFCECSKVNVGMNLAEQVALR